MIGVEQATYKPGTRYPWKTTRTGQAHVVLDPLERNPDQDITPPKPYMTQLEGGCASIAGSCCRRQAPVCIINY